jgi:hypothetical protein
MATLAGPLGDVKKALSPSHGSMNQPFSRSSPEGQHVCEIDGCAQSYRRRGDLTRHKRKHGSQQETFDCRALHCDRVGKKGFLRRDKLNDHMLAGHDEDTSVTCGYCGKNIPRDLVSLHGPSMYRGIIGAYRTCPVPRCSFKVHIHDFRSDAQFVRMDRLQNHLLEKHDLNHRLTFLNLLKQRGYDAGSCNTVCPICPTNPQFDSHGEFAQHFMQTHFDGPACLDHKERSCRLNCWGRKSRQWPMNCISVPIEVHRHRRTILRIFPDFRNYLVWEDVRRCNLVRSGSQPVV